MSYSSHFRIALEYILVIDDYPCVRVHIKYTGGAITYGTPEIVTTDCRVLLEGVEKGLALHGKD